MSEQTIQIGNETYIRSWARAKVVRAKAEEIPEPILRASAEVESKLHWSDGTNPDLVHVKFILDTEGANDNWDYMPRAQLLSAHASAIFKPMDMSHIIKEQSSMMGCSKDSPPVKNTICGVMTATASAWAATGELLTADELKNMDMKDDWNREDDDKVAVVAWGALYSFLFPKTVADITKAIDEGDMFVSMERWIGKHDFLVWDAGKADFVAMSKQDAIDAGHSDRWTKHQKVNGKQILRRSLSYVYGGAATTMIPANKMARFVEPSYVKAAASQQEISAELKNLLQAHSECHRAFVISTGVSKQAALIERHRRITAAIAALTTGN